MTLASAFAIGGILTWPLLPDGALIRTLSMVCTLSLGACLGKGIDRGLAARRRRLHAASEPALLGNSADEVDGEAAKPDGSTQAVHAGDATHAADAAEPTVSAARERARSAEGNCR